MIHRVLVVDDEPHLTRLVQRYLETNGYSVEAAHSGAEALEKVRQDRPDLLLCDVLMQKMDGFAVVQHIRSNPSLSDLPIIMMGATPCLWEEHQSYMARVHELVGDVGWVAKPFNVAEIGLAIQRLENT